MHTHKICRHTKAYTDTLAPYPHSQILMLTHVYICMYVCIHFEIST